MESPLRRICVCPDAQVGWKMAGDGMGCAHDTERQTRLGGVTTLGECLADLRGPHPDGA